MGYIIYIHMYVLLNNCFFIKLKPHGKDFSDSNRINLYTLFFKEQISEQNEKQRGL